MCNRVLTLTKSGKIIKIKGENDHFKKFCYPNIYRKKGKTVYSFLRKAVFKSWHFMYNLGCVIFGLFKDLHNPGFNLTHTHCSSP
jgi:hypothetical protein